MQMRRPSGVGPDKCARTATQVLLVRYNLSILCEFEQVVTQGTILNLPFDNLSAAPRYTVVLLDKSQHFVSAS